MKKGKRLLAVIMAACLMTGLVSLGFTSFAASPTLQSMIDAAGIRDTVVLSSNTRESVVIENKIITLDLNGKTLDGAFGQSTITIKNSTVAIVNGQVYSYFAKVSTEDMLKTVTKSEYSKPTINIQSGSVYFNGLFVDGMQIRIPTTNTYSAVPVSSAVFVNKDAYLTIEKSAFVGCEWGLANGYGSHVTIIDGAFAGFDKGIKHEAEVTYTSTTTSRVSLSDMSEKLFKYGVTLRDDQLQAMTAVLGDRVIAYVHNAVPKVETTYNNGTLTVVAEADLSNVVSNIEYSYKWLPESVTVEGVKKTFEQITGTNKYVAIFNGVSATTAGNPGSLTSTYRLWLGLNSEENEIVTKFVSTIKNAYNDIGPELIKLYADAIESYEDYIAEFSKIYYQMDDLANNNILGNSGPTFETIVEFKNLFTDLYLIGGQTMYKYIEDNLEPKHDYYYDDIGISNYFGITSGQPKLLDEIEALKTKIDALDFNDYASVIYFVYDNYQDVIDILELAQTYGDKLVTDLNTEKAADIVNALTALGNTKVTGYIADIKKYVSYIGQANGYIAKVLALDEAQDAISFIDANRADLEILVEDAFDAVERLDKYVAPTVKDGYIHLYSQNNEFDYEAFTPVKAEVIVNGTGKVEYASEVDSGETINGTETMYYPNTDVTLTAVETSPEIEFLYWVNSDTNRILSTDPVCTLSTNISTRIEAVFNDSSWGYQVAYTNTSGDISGVEFYNPDVDDAVYVTTAIPYMARCTFVSWPHVADDGYGNAIIPIASLAANSAAYVGSLKTSAFDESSDKYENAIVPVKPGSGNYIVVPKYDISGKVHITYDNGSGLKSVNYNLYADASITAPSANFSYWINGNGEIVSLYPTFEFKAVQDNTYYAVYNAATVPDAVNTIVGIYRDAANDQVTFYAERSSKYTVKKSGIVLTFDPVVAADNAAFVPGGANVLTGTAKYTTLTGNYGVTKNSYTGDPIYARAYIEIEYTSGQRVTLYSNTVLYQD